MGFVDVNLEKVPDLVVHTGGQVRLKVRFADLRAGKENPDRSIIFLALEIVGESGGPYQSVLANCSVPLKEDSKDNAEIMLRMMKDLMKGLGYNFANGVETDELVGLEGSAIIKEIQPGVDQFGHRNTISAWLAPG